MPDSIATHELTERREICALFVFYSCCRRDQALVFAREVPKLLPAFPVTTGSHTQNTNPNLLMYSRVLRALPVLAVSLAAISCTESSGPDESPSSNVHNLPV